MNFLSSIIGRGSETTGDPEKKLVSVDTDETVKSSESSMRENSHTTTSRSSAGGNAANIPFNVFNNQVSEFRERFPLTLSSSHGYVEADEFLKQREANLDEAKTKYANSYSELPASEFQVRGKNYLTKAGKNMKELKEASASELYEVIGVNMFHCDRRIRHVSEEVGELKRYFEMYPADEPDALLPTFLVINWILTPLFGRECWVVSHVFRLRKDRSPDPALEKAFARFMAGSDSQKNSMFKYMFRIVDAPGAVKSTISAMGGERPVIIGKSLTTTYHKGNNYLEVNMDVSSSRIASAINSVLLKNMKNIVCDCGWLIEGQHEDELPERLLATIRWNWNTVDDVVIKLDTKGERI